jgi:hypothetical protein
MNMNTKHIVPEADRLRYTVEVIAENPYMHPNSIARKFPELQLRHGTDNPLWQQPVSDNLIQLLLLQLREHQYNLHPVIRTGMTLGELQSAVLDAAPADKIERGFGLIWTVVSEAELELYWLANI